MQVFKCALGIVFKNPTLLIIYAVTLSFMGVAIASGISTNAAEDGTYERPMTQVAVVDRDGSDVSAGIGEFLGAQGELVQVEDTEMALQDAVAKGQAAYMLIIPEGFGAQLLDAAASDADTPRMEAVYGYSSAEGALVDARLANYISALETLIRADAGVDISAVSKKAADIAQVEAETSIIGDANVNVSQYQFPFYLKFDIYVFFASIIACLGSLLSTLNRPDVRRRVLIAPMSDTARNLQIGLACLVVITMIWAWVMLLGIVVFWDSVATIGAPGVAFMAITAFCFALVCLAVAFLVGQLGLGAVASNAIGNILGLVVSFLGGAWMPLEIAGPGVEMAAHFLPGYWYTQALTQAANLGSGGMEALVSIASCLGVLLLFAAAIFSVGLVVGKMRVQTSESGGNAIAETIVA